MTHPKRNAPTAATVEALVQQIHTKGFDMNARDEVAEMQGPTDNAPQILEAINPIIAGTDWNADTAYNVKCVLEFMADAVPALSRMGYNKEAAHGMHVILRTIAAAVEVCHGK